MTMVGTHTGREQHRCDYQAYVSYHPDDMEWVDNFIYHLEHFETREDRRIANNDHDAFPLIERNVPAAEVINEADDVSLLTSGNPFLEDEKELQQRQLKGDAIRVYYEWRDWNHDMHEIEQIGRAVYSSQNVICCLSTSYLVDSRKQFELDLILHAMIERHDYSANDHIVLIALQQTGELMQLLPRQFRAHFSHRSLNWSDTNVMQR